MYWRTVFTHHEPIAILSNPHCRHRLTISVQSGFVSYMTLHNLIIKITNWKQIFQTFSERIRVPPFRGQNDMNRPYQTMLFMG